MKSTTSFVRIAGPATGGAVGPAATDKLGGIIGTATAGAGGTKETAVVGDRHQAGRQVEPVWPP